MKGLLVKETIAHLEAELANLLLAAKNAHLAATDDQSIAETQYDTLAIEASYLAEGQSRRVLELQQALEAFKKLNYLQKHNEVRLGSLVQLEQDSKSNCWFFIAPAAAGYRTTIASDKVTVITPHSPIGKALVAKCVDDEISLLLGNNQLTEYIVAIK